MTYLEIVKEVLQLMPLISQLVDQVEHILPQGGKGQEKLEMVKNMLTTAASTGGIAVDTFNAIWPTVSVLIAGFVAMRK